MRRAWIVAATLAAGCALEVGATLEGAGAVLAQPPCGGASSFGAPEPWAAPIADALAVGERAFPDGFQRGITALAVWPQGPGGRLWMGYGDANKNLGSRTPIELRSFVAPERPDAVAARVLAGPPWQREAQGAPQRTPTDTGEEQIDAFRVGTLCVGGCARSVLLQAGVDSNDPDEGWTQAKRATDKPIEGNVFLLEQQGGEPMWRKWRSLRGGEHVHDVATFEGALYAVGSGADTRTEWDEGKVFRYLWRSDDGGATFRTVHRVVTPNPGKTDTRFRRLLVVGSRLHAFGYVNPFEGGGPLEGRHVTLERGVLAPLTGALERLVVARTFPLRSDLGLVIVRGAEAHAPTRAFALTPCVTRELASWSGRRVVDVAPGRGPGEWFVLASDARADGRFEVLRVRVDDLARLEPVLDLGTTACMSLALWRGDLYVGTADGRILRSRAQGGGGRGARDRQR